MFISKLQLPLGVSATLFTVSETPLTVIEPLRATNLANSCGASITKRHEAHPHHLEHRQVLHQPFGTGIQHGKELPQESRIGILHVAWIGARNLKCNTKTITRKASAIRSESRCGLKKHQHINS